MVLTTALSSRLRQWLLARRRRCCQLQPSKCSPMSSCTSGTRSGCSAELLPTSMCWPRATARHARLGRRRANARRCERGAQLLFVHVAVRSELADPRTPLPHHHCHVPDACRSKIRPGSRSSTGKCTLHVSPFVPVPSAGSHVIFRTSSLLSAAYHPYGTCQTATLLCSRANRAAWPLTRTKLR